MDKTSLLIWTTLLVAVLLAEYRAWTRSTTPAHTPWWRIALWIACAFCGWSITIDLGWELLYQLASFLLLLAQVALIVGPAIYIHHRRSLRAAMEKRHE